VTTTTRRHPQMFRSNGLLSAAAPQRYLTRYLMLSDQNQPLQAVADPRLLPLRSEQRIVLLDGSHDCVCMKKTCTQALVHLPAAAIDSPRSETACGRPSWADLKRDSTAICQNVADTLVVDPTRSRIKRDEWG
jgi:hypothetical protein